MDASTAQIVGAVFTALLLATWSQHREIRKSREETNSLIKDSNNQLRTDFADHKRTVEKSHDQLRTDFADHKRTVEKSHDQLRADFADHKRITESNHQTTQKHLGKVADLLRDARERLARIEGFLRIEPAKPPAP